MTRMVMIKTSNITTIAITINARDRILMAITMPIIKNANAWTLIILENSKETVTVIIIIALAMAMATITTIIIIEARPTTITIIKIIKLNTIKNHPFPWDIKYQSISLTRKHRMIP